MLRRFVSMLPVLVTFAATALVGITADAAQGVDGLSVSGNQLVYRGKPVHLRGIGVGDVYHLRRRDAAQDYQTLATEWKANVVRLSVHPGTWRGHKTETLALLKEHVRLAIANGLFVIIDYHAIGFPGGYYQKLYNSADPRTVTEAYDSNLALAKDFWRTVSKTINDSRVMFELWNEPVSGKDEDSATAVKAWPKLKRYFESLTAIIRRNGNRSVILATGGCWAYCLKGIKTNLLADPQSAYTWHVYAGHDGNDAAKWAEALDELHAVRPVIVTEWGFEPDAKAHYKGTAEDFGNKFRDEFLEKRVLHNVAWCWIPGWGPSLQLSDWKTRTTWGDFLFDYLTTVNSSPDRP